MKKLLSVVLFCGILATVHGGEEVSTFLTIKSGAQLKLQQFSTNGFLKLSNFSTGAVVIDTTTYQPLLNFTPENVANKRTTFQVTPDDTHYPSEKLVKDSLDAKQPLGSYESPLTFSAPLSRSTNTVSIPAASALTDGYLDKDDFAAFLAKADPYLESNTARVDASGNDGTGTIGRMDKPFATFAGAMAALETRYGETIAAGDVSATSGSATITSTAGIFRSYHTSPGNRPIKITGAGAGGSEYAGLIQSVTNANTAILNTPVSTSVTDSDVKIASASEHIAIYVNGQYPAAVTTSLRQLLVIGRSWLDTVGNITIVENFGLGQDWIFVNCYAGDISNSNDFLASISYNLINAGAGNLSGRIDQIFGLGLAETGSVTSDTSLSLNGLTAIFGTLTSAGSITLGKCGGYYNGQGNPSIDNGSGDVTAFHSYLQDVVSAGTLTLIDSRVTGANNATSTVYSDVLLAKSFTQLLDAPNSYTGEAGKITAVKGDESGLEFIDPATGGDMFKADNLSGLANYTTARSNLGLAIGTDVQAYDANLTTWAGITPGTGVGTALAINVGSAGAFLLNNGSAANLTSFPTLNQNTTGSAATLTTARPIYGNNFDGSAALTQIIASTYGGTGNGFTKFTGPTTTEKTKTVRNADDTILELGGSYTPTGTWTWTSATTDRAKSGSNSDITALTGTVQATNAQAIAHSSSTTVISPATLAFGMFGWSWRDLAMSEITSGTTSGVSASTSSGGGLVIVSTGATASSWAHRDQGSVRGIGVDTGGNNGPFDFDKVCGFVLSFRNQSATTNGRSRFSVSNSFAADGSGNTGKLNAKGFGIEIQNQALYAALHDGTTYTTTSLSTSLTANTTAVVMCIRSGSGTFDYYVNGVFKATATGGPTGTGAAVPGVRFAVDNNGDAADQQFWAFHLKLFQALQ